MFPPRIHRQSPPPPEAAAPNFSLNGGSYFGTRRVELTSRTPDAVIRFVLQEGTSAPDPTPESPLYTAPVELTAGTLGNPKSYTLSARAFKDGMTPSPVVRAAYSIDAPKARAEISIEAGNLYGTQQLTMSSPDNAEIRYESVKGTAADGTPNTPPREPVQGDVSDGTGSPIYDTSATPPATITLTQGSVETPKIYTYWIRAFKEGFNPGDIIKLTFRVYPPKAAPVVIAQEPGEAFGSTILKLSSPTPGAEIRYLLTRDGSEPGEPVQGHLSAGGSPIYNPAASPLSIKPERLNQTKTFKIKARAFKADLSPSDVSPTAAFPLKVAVKQVYAGGYHEASGSAPSTLFLLLEDGSVWGVGDNRYGQLGNGTTTSTSSPMVTTFTRVMEDADTPLTEAKEVSGSWKFTAVLKNDGTVYTFGDNTYGQLGRGDSPSVTSYAVSTGTSGIVSIAAGMDHLILVNRSGGAVAAGRNSRTAADGTVTTTGQLASGDGLNIPRQRSRFGAMRIYASEPVTNIRKAAAGAYHSLLLTRDGRVWVSGENGEGQLGIGSRDHTDRLRRSGSSDGLGGLTDVKDISGSVGNSLFVKNNGELWGAGSNGTAKLGMPRQIDGVGWIYRRTSAVQLGVFSGTDGSLETPITDAAKLPRGNHIVSLNFYIDTAGRIHAAGSNLFGQFPFETVNILPHWSGPRFTGAQGLRNVESLTAAAGGFSVFLMADGSLKAANRRYASRWPFRNYLEAVFAGNGYIQDVNPLKVSPTMLTPSPPPDGLMAGGISRASRAASSGVLPIDD